MTPVAFIQKESKPRLLFVVTEDWYFVSHRLHLAEAAKAAGYHVGLMTRVSRHKEVIEQSGIELFDWRIRRRSFNPLNEFDAIRQLVSTYRRFKPRIVHHVALKPVIYGAMAARMAGVECIVQALGGLGFVFSSNRLSARSILPVIKRLYSAALAGRRTRLILQNPDDCNLLINAGVIAHDRIRLIRGSGVDTGWFSPKEEDAGLPIVMLPSRLLWDKGVGDFVEIARRFRQEGKEARFVLVGDPDDENPSSVPIETIRSWCREGIVEWWGRREDMPFIISQSHVVCLPSYREGLPKSLLEAASCARPIVTYDVPGCREVVNHGENGLLVPLHNIDMLAGAVRSLVDSQTMRRRMGVAGRELVLRFFSAEMVAEQTLEIYQELMP
jgi:glycosyltransferase involved in cell wall biosynthesis